MSPEDFSAALERTLGVKVSIEPRDDGGFVVGLDGIEHADNLVLTYRLAQQDIPPIECSLALMLLATNSVTRH